MKHLAKNYGATVTLPSGRQFRMESATAADIAVDGFNGFFTAFLATTTTTGGWRGDGHKYRSSSWENPTTMNGSLPPEDDPRWPVVAAIRVAVYGDSIPEPGASPAKDCAAKLGGTAQDWLNAMHALGDKAEKIYEMLPENVQKWIPAPLVRRLTPDERRKVFYALRDAGIDQYARSDILPGTTPEEVYAHFFGEGPVYNAPAMDVIRRVMAAL